MNRTERKLSQAKNKISGVAKQIAGKITGDEVLELKGRIQSSQADLQKRTDVDDAIQEIKKSAEQGKATIAKKINDAEQSVAKSINDSLDAHAQKKSE
jgi:uncharacterized protein YjbJ (UPF0337 family)